MSANTPSILLSALIVPPLLGAALLLLCGRRLAQRGSALLGVGSVALSAIAWALAAAAYGGRGAFDTVLWRWWSVGERSAEIALRLDALSLLLSGVVCWVGLLIHVYSVEHMRGESPRAYARFFGALNLFVGAMLILALADDLLLLYLGWEGVGLCSFLLIGFARGEEHAARAARKAFIVTRIGDVAFAIGLLVLLSELGTLRIGELLQRAAAGWGVSAGPALLAAALLLAGAVAKSAQIPLQTWLPDAMAGPAPVSALIHAATMVTAGVYLVARMHGLFVLAPQVQSAAALLGAATMLAAACSALVEREIKRVLAYSTISQLGYMFVALGVGAPAAAVFHLLTHAFFKAQLFLGAGVVIQHSGEHDLARLGGLRRSLPVTCWTMVAAGASLAGLPLVTAGFYSKELLLARVWDSGAHALWVLAVCTSLLTALYTFRLLLLTFFGAAPPARATDAAGHGHAAGYRPGALVQAPLVLLALLALGAGLIELPEPLGELQLFSRFIGQTFAAAHAGQAPTSHVGPALLLLVVPALAVIAGLLLALRFYGRARPHASDEPRAIGVPGVPAVVQRLWQAGWGFDRAYDTLIVRPLLRLAHAMRGDPLGIPFEGLAATARSGHRALRLTQSGRLRGYAAAIVLGVVLLLALVVLQ